MTTPTPDQDSPPMSTSDQDVAGSGHSHLNVNPADLHKAADEYTHLQACAARITPQAVEEVNRIIATHGLMGYPAAVGIVAGLARREAKVAAKAAEFGQYAQRFTEHAATYRGEDAAGAGRMSGVDFSPAP